MDFSFIAVHRALPRGHRGDRSNLKIPVTKRKTDGFPLLVTPLRGFKLFNGTETLEQEINDR